MAHQGLGLALGASLRSRARRLPGPCSSRSSRKGTCSGPESFLVCLLDATTRSALGLAPGASLHSRARRLCAPCSSRSSNSGKLPAECNRWPQVPGRMVLVQCSTSICALSWYVVWLPYITQSMCIAALGTVVGLYPANREMLPCLGFCFSKKLVDQLAQSLWDMAFWMACSPQHIGALIARLRQSLRHMLCTGRCCHAWASASARSGWIS